MIDRKSIIDHDQLFKVSRSARCSDQIIQDTHLISNWDDFHAFDPGPGPYHS